MKPKNIFLVRHGESEGNVDYSFYGQKPDYKILLTEKGKEQALEAGKKLSSQLLSAENTFFFVSPLWRTRMTFEGIAKSISDDLSKIKWQEEPRIREQEWGHLRNEEECWKVDKERNDFGSFYYRIPDGESCADVFDRMSDFFNTLHRDFQKTDFPNNCIIITHGTAIKCFLMKWFHWTVEEFESIKNPKNCEIIQMSLQENNKYKLNTELQRKEINSDIVYKWNGEFAFEKTPAFEVLRIRRAYVEKRTERFFLTKKEIYIHKLEIFTKEDDEFIKVLNSIKTNSTIYNDFKIDCVKRIGDNVVFKYGDEINYCLNGIILNGIISCFYLDGFNYIGEIIKSKSGIQASFGGGTFVDITNLNKIK